uniref:Uncharacterized protein n=1 Tax=Physcomitrium patens TaxID=3218 RepID=A0A7I4DV16_PHYPA
MEAVSVHLGGSAPIHAIATKQGIMFSMSQVAVEVFNENPAAFGKELRRQRYPRVRTIDTVTLMRLAQLGIPPESANVVGATLLPPNSLLRILDDRRRMDLIPKVQAAMLKMITKTVTDLITRGHYEEALPFAMDAVAKGQTLYWPREPLRMVPLYLLAVKVNLGLCRPTQAQDLLGVGAWLLLQDKSDGPKDELRSEISQLFGKLSVLNPAESSGCITEGICRGGLLQVKRIWSLRRSHEYCLLQLIEGLLQYESNRPCVGLLGCCNALMENGA